MKMNRSILKFFRLCLPAALFLTLPLAAVADRAQYLYDDLGRLRAVIDASGNAAIYSYDAVGNLLSITRHGAGEVTILSISPTQGAVDTEVVIQGIGFSALSVQNQVRFGGGAQAVVSSASPTEITAIVPDGAHTGPITVTTPTGSATSAQSFAVLPGITSISPNFGFQGKTITAFIVTGTNLQGATSIQFTPSDGISVANPPEVSPDGHSATVGVTISAGASIQGRVVTITNPDGTSSAAATDRNTFAVLPNEPIVAEAAAVMIFVQSPPSEALSQSTVGVYVEPVPPQSVSDLLGVLVEPMPDPVFAPYVGVELPP
jgi:YD repeat-containing protein